MLFELKLLSFTRSTLFLVTLVSENCSRRMYWYERVHNKLYAWILGDRCYRWVSTL